MWLHNEAYSAAVSSDQSCNCIGAGIWPQVPESIALISSAGEGYRVQSPFLHLIIIKLAIETIAGLHYWGDNTVNFITGIGDASGSMKSNKLYGLTANQVKRDHQEEELETYSTMSPIRDVSVGRVEDQSISMHVNMVYGATPPQSPPKFEDYHTYDYITSMNH